MKEREMFESVLRENKLKEGKLANPTVVIEVEDGNWCIEEYIVDEEGWTGNPKKQKYRFEGPLKTFCNDIKEYYDEEQQIYVSKKRIYDDAMRTEVGKGFSISGDIDSLHCKILSK